MFTILLKSKGSVSQLMDDLDLINSVEQVEVMVNSIQKGAENQKTSALVMLENLLGVWSVPHFSEANQICMNTLLDCAAPDALTKISSTEVRIKSDSPWQIESYSRNLMTINFSDVSMYLLLTLEGN